MYAVIKTGGKQYKVAKNDVILVERLPGEAGASIELDEVLLVGDEKGQTVGAPTVEGAHVAATVLEQTRGDKIIVFKKKRRQNYRRKAGHRQDLTALRITDIVTGGKKKTAAKAEAPKAEEKKAAPKKAEPATITKMKDEAEPSKIAGPKPEAEPTEIAKPKPAAEPGEIATPKSRAKKAPAKTAKAKPAAAKAPAKKAATKKPAAKTVSAKPAAEKKAPAKKAAAKKPASKKD